MKYPPFCITKGFLISGGGKVVSNGVTSCPLSSLFDPFKAFGEDFFFVFLSNKHLKVEGTS